jgi:hypothetical protein
VIAEAFVIGRNLVALWANHEGYLPGTLLVRFKNGYCVSIPTGSRIVRPGVQKNLKFVAVKRLRALRGTAGKRREAYPRTLIYKEMLFLDRDGNTGIPLVALLTVHLNVDPRLQEGGAARNCLGIQADASQNVIPGLGLGFVHQRGVGGRS